MVKLNDLAGYLESYLDVAAYKDYCPNGLQVEGKTEIKCLATGVSASLETIERAVEAGADALLVHHGMFWSGDSYRIEGVKKEKLRLLIDNGLSLLAYHLPLDGHREIGNNWKAAMDLGLTDLEPFGVVSGVPSGVKGKLSSVAAAEWTDRLQEYYQHPVHAAAFGPEAISSVGIISGGAHKYITQAVNEGLDCFITGSFDEPIWHIAREEGIHFCALGHSNTERIGPLALGQHLADQFGVEWSFIEVPNPF